MVYVHHFFDETDSNCLAPFIDQWPRNGVLRVEVVRNLKKFNAYQDRLLGKVTYLPFLGKQVFLKVMYLNPGCLPWLKLFGHYINAAISC